MFRVLVLCIYVTVPLSVNSLLVSSFAMDSIVIGDKAKCIETSSILFICRRDWCVALKLTLPCVYDWDAFSLAIYCTFFSDVTGVPYHCKCN